MLAAKKLQVSKEYAADRRGSTQEIHPRLQPGANVATGISIGFFTIGLSDAFQSDYLTDLKLHSAK